MMVITTQKHSFLCFLKTEPSYGVYQLHPRGLSFLLVKPCCWLTLMHFTAGMILPFPEIYSLSSYSACKELLGDLLRGHLSRPHAWAQLTTFRCIQVICQLWWCLGFAQEALSLPSTKACGSRPFCSMLEVGPVEAVLNSIDEKQSGWKLSSPWWCDGVGRKSMGGSRNGNIVEVRQVSKAGL